MYIPLTRQTDSRCQIIKCLTRRVDSYLEHMTCLVFQNALLGRDPSEIRYLCTNDRNKICKRYTQFFKYIDHNCISLTATADLCLVERDFVPPAVSDTKPPKLRLKFGKRGFSYA